MNDLEFVKEYLSLCKKYNRTIEYQYTTGDYFVSSKDAEMFGYMEKQLRKDYG